MPIGTILGVFRAGRSSTDTEPFVKAVLQDGAEIEAAYSGHPPCPLTRCWFSEGPSYRVEAPYGTDQRVIVHDDFTRVPTTTGTSGSIACDTNWTYSNTTGGSISQWGAGIGAALIGTATTLNAITWINKDDNCITPVTAPAGLWCSAKVIQDATAGRTTTIGFRDSAGSELCEFFFTAAATVWSTQCAQATTATTLATACTINGGPDGTTDDLDIVFVSATWAAFWVNGDGPYVIETNVPSSATTLYVLIQNTTAGTARFTVCDYIRVEYVSNLVHPNDFTREPV